MEKISLDFTLNWSFDHFSPEEKRPEVKVFFDSRINREPIRIEHKDKHVYIKGRIEGTTKSEFLPHNLHIGLAGFAWRKNDEGFPCLMDVGTAHINVRDIHDELKRSDKFQHVLPLIMHTTRVEAKEQLTFTVTAGGLQMSPNLDFGRPLVDTNLVAADMNQYIQASLNVEQAMPDAIPGTSRIRVPAYIGEAGLELTNGQPLPAVGFVFSETPKSNRQFWRNAFENVMRRDNLLVDDFDRLNIAGQARVAALMVTNMVQVFDYVSDTVDLNTPDAPYDKRKINPIEQFSSSLNTGSGDCEDGGSAIDMCIKAFVKQDFDPKVDQKLLHLREIMNQYVPVFTLAAVRGAAVADDTEHIGAHMNVNLIPAAKFRQWMSVSREGRKLASTLPWEKPTAFSDQLPFLIAEGTGPYEPLGYTDPYDNAKGYVYQVRSLAPYRKPIGHKYGETTSFFVGSLTGLTSYFFVRGGNVGSFFYGTKVGQSISRGVTYNDMMNNPEKVAIIMHEKLPAHVLSVIKDSVSIRVPPEPLILTNKSDSILEKNGTLDYIKGAVQKFNRPVSKDDTVIDVPIYIKDYQIDKEKAQKIVVEMQQLGHIVAFDYYEEKYTDKFYGYCAQVKVKLNK